MPEFPESIADYIAGLTNSDFTNGGHRQNFIPTAQGTWALALYVEAKSVDFADFAAIQKGEIETLRDQVETDAASAAAGSGTEVTVEQIWGGAAAQYLSIRRTYEAMAPVALNASPTTIAVDLAAGINFSLALAANRTLGNPSNALAGQSGFIIVTQDATGGRTLARGSNWRVAGGDLLIDTAPNSKSVISYYVESPTSILATISERFS